MAVKYEAGSIQPCKNCKEEIGFVLWGNSDHGWWRHTERDTFYCDEDDYGSYGKEAEPNQPECKCNKVTNEFCAHCGTAEQLASAGIVGFNSPAEAFGSIDERLAEASAADILFEMELERFGEYND